MPERNSNVVDRLLDAVGRRLARKLNAPSAGYKPFTPSDFDTLCQTLRPGDVLLVEGRERVSNAIKYLTQSTWSHAAMYVGDRLETRTDDGERHRLVEVNLGEGCVSAPLSRYARYNTRICRPVGLTPEERDQVIAFMTTRIGLSYDLRNIFDLLRYFLPTPPVPVRWRRRMLAIGSGDPTRAICSSLIARAFQSVRYPILPDVRTIRARQGSNYARREILHIRHHSLFTPRDFDLSPWFQVVKPNLEAGFDPHLLEWGEGSAADAVEEKDADEDEEAGRDTEPAKEPEPARQHVFCE
ncbi:MAG: YiiX/YebB-like N1pC/P60 family cysteine hydrolase [Pseudomonadota bacterium]